ncbi:hypothetical protein BGX23_003317 [Mortierella sp. AD031]|nr:hypothetical protein BGX23_003317 [Mortierella sp. AD031]
MDQPSSRSPFPTDGPNVCLRFCLGPTNHGLLCSEFDVMNEHPVVIEQRDFRYDVYGRPADVANAIAYTFLDSSKDPTHSAQGSGAVSDVSPEQKSPPSSSVMMDTGKEQQDRDMTAQAVGPALGNDLSTTTTTTRASDDQSACLNSSPKPEDSMDSNNSNNNNNASSPPPPPKIPSSSEAAVEDVVPQRSFTLDPHKRKTDYDIAWERYFGKNNITEQPPPDEIQEANLWSAVVLLSMPFRVAQYMMLNSQGFMTYLVEEPDLDACERQGISLERLKIIARQAGMSVAVSSIRLPSLGGGPEDSFVWLQVGDRKALRAVLLGVSNALAHEPAREIIWKELGQQEQDLHREWDGRLNQTRTSGTTSNGQEWVMDDPASRQENVRSADMARWGEPSVLMENRRRSWDKYPTTIYPQSVQRRRSKRTRHPVNTSRMPSPPPRVPEHRRRHERDGWSSRATADRGRRDNQFAERERWEKPLVVEIDPWTTTTSQSVGSFFTESEHNGPDMYVNDREVGPPSSSSLGVDSQGSGQSSRSASSQEGQWTDPCVGTGEADYVEPSEPNVV